MSIETLAISSIIINRDKRQRRELKDIEQLAESIKRNGLIQPVVVDENLNLIAGERRTAAHVLLGRTHIEVVRKENLTAAERERIELEENIKRQALTWKDECSAVARYFQIRKAEDPSFTQLLCAEELAMSDTTVASHLAVFNEIERGNTLVLAAEKMSAAKNITARATERRNAEVFESIITDLKLPGVPGASVETTITPPRIAPILNEDFHEFAQSYSGRRFDFLHCDFPYGVNADKHDQGAAKYFGGYADSPDIYWQLIATLGLHMDTLVAEEAHMIFWYSLDYHTETRLALEQMGWRVNPFPLIWFKSDNTGILPDPQRGPRRVYETAYFCSRGDRKIVSAVANCFAAPSTNQVHQNEKSLPMLAHFFRMCVDETTHVFDPTCGSANSLIAANNHHAASVLGLEKDPAFAEAAVRNWLKKEEEAKAFVL